MEPEALIVPVVVGRADLDRAAVEGNLEALLNALGKNAAESVRQLAIQRGWIQESYGD